MKYTKNYKYRLEEDLTLLTNVFITKAVQTDWIGLSVKGELYINKGYAWDGSPGPVIDTDNSMMASCAHDALYQLMRKKFLPESYRRKCNLLYYDLCEEAGMYWARRKLQYFSVAEFAESSASPKDSRIISEV